MYPVSVSPLYIPQIILFKTLKNRLQTSAFLKRKQTYLNGFSATTFFDYINSRHPNIRFIMEKQVNHKLPFLNVLIDNNDPNSSLTNVYRKKTLTGLLTNYFSFTSYSHKVGLIKTLFDRAYKINFLNFINFN